MFSRVAYRTLVVFAPALATLSFLPASVTAASVIRPALHDGPAMLAVPCICTSSTVPSLDDDEQSEFIVPTGTPNGAPDGQAEGSPCHRETATPAARAGRWSPARAPPLPSHLS